MRDGFFVVAFSSFCFSTLPIGHLPKVLVRISQLYRIILLAAAKFLLMMIICCYPFASCQAIIASSLAIW